MRVESSLKNYLIIFPGSSTVERRPVKALVVRSNRTRGAKIKMDQNESKPKENPAIPKIICGILTLATIATILLGFYYKNPFIIICGIIPAAIYEMVRTEGYYTRSSSIIITILVILEVLAIKGVIKFNLANWMGRDQAYFGGYWLPLGDITFIFPAVAVILSIVLFFRTYGVYTKWLAILLLASSACLLYLVNKETLFELIRTQNYYY